MYTQDLLTKFAREICAYPIQKIPEIKGPRNLLFELSFEKKKLNQGF